MPCACVGRQGPEGDDALSVGQRSDRRRAGGLSRHRLPHVDQQPLLVPRRRSRREQPRRRRRVLVEDVERPRRASEVASPARLDARLALPRGGGHRHRGDRGVLEQRRAVQPRRLQRDDLARHSRRSRRGPRGRARLAPDVLAAAALLGRPSHVHADGRRGPGRPGRVEPRRGCVAPSRLLLRRPAVHRLLPCRRLHRQRLPPDHLARRPRPHPRRVGVAARGGGPRRAARPARLRRGAGLRGRESKPPSTAPAGGTRRSAGGASASTASSNRQAYRTMRRA